ncbi:MAG: hypothetical protein M3Z24_09295, partial [Chloroflexota bacterium]|nr:hypothetical protein [Chloroflexota bacterium]
MNRYLAVMIKYSWVLVVCVVLAVGAGYIIGKSQPVSFQATTIVVVAAGSAGTNVTTGTQPQVSVTQSNDEAILYSAEIQGRTFLQYMYDHDPKIKAAGYTVTDLITNISATSATATSPTTSSSSGTYASGPLIFITATGLTPNDTVLLANDAAVFFQVYNDGVQQGYLDASRNSLIKQIATLQTNNTNLEHQINGLPTGSAQAATLTADRSEITAQVDKLQTQLNNLATTIKGDAFASQTVDNSEVTATSKASIII